MEYLNIITLFISAFTVVCLLGLQSQFVRDKLVLQSFVTSLGIGLCQVVQYKLTPNASLVESGFFILGGAMGITSSIYIHNFLVRGRNG